LVSDVSLCEEYNQKIDVYSLMPILSVPLNVRPELVEVTIGVLQVALRDRAKERNRQQVCLTSERRDFFQETQALICQFAEIVREAYRFVYSKIGDHKMEELKDYGVKPQTPSSIEDLALGMPAAGQKVKSN